MEAELSITEPHDDRDGKYADESRELLIKHGASATLVIVIGGERGTGFSFSAIRREMAQAIPEVLREVAKEIEGESQEKPS